MGADLWGEPYARLPTGRGDAGRHSPWSCVWRGNPPWFKRNGVPGKARSAYGMALGTATAGPEAALAGRSSDGATRTRRTGDGVGRIATKESGFDKACQQCNIGPCVETDTMRGDMAHVIDFSGRNAAAVETGKGHCPASWPGVGQRQYRSFPACPATWAVK